METICRYNQTIYSTKRNENGYMSFIDQILDFRFGFKHKC